MNHINLDNFLQIAFHKILLMSALILTITLPINTYAGNDHKSIILFIGDGMGKGYTDLGETALGKKLRYQTFPHKNESDTSNASGGITDSAAGATAIATGHKVNNGVISVALPGTGEDLKTILEEYQAQGKSVGVITNTYIDDATPAAFAAHTTNRGDFCGIWADYFTKTKPNLILGHNYPIETDTCAGKNVKQIAEENGYVVAQTWSQLQSIDSSSPYVLGIFGLHNSIPEKFLDADLFFPFTEGPLSITDESYFESNDIPRLRQMITAAVEILSKNPKGYFLMVENSHPDRVGHAHELYDNDVFCVFLNVCLSPPSSKEILSAEMKSVNIEIETILKSINNDPNVLVIVTADHETGGLQVTNKNPLEIVWTGECADEFDLGPDFEYCGHTGANVGIFATGKNSQLFQPRKPLNNKPMQNTDIHKLMLNQ